MSPPPGSARWNEPHRTGCSVQHLACGVVRQEAMDKIARVLAHHRVGGSALAEEVHDALNRLAYLDVALDATDEVRRHDTREPPARFVVRP